MTALLYTIGVVLFLVGISASIALHELGHALGLGESSYTYNCMYSGYSRNITLSFADRRSLDEVYAAKVNG